MILENLPQLLPGNSTSLFKCFLQSESKWDRLGMYLYPAQWTLRYHTPVVFISHFIPRGDVENLHPTDVWEWDSMYHSPGSTCSMSTGWTVHQAWCLIYWLWTHMNCSSRWLKSIGHVSQSSWGGKASMSPASGSTYIISFWFGVGRACRDLHSLHSLGC